MRATTIVQYGTYHPNTPDDITWHESEYDARDYARMYRHKLVTQTKTTMPTLNPNIVEKVTTTHQDGHTTIIEGHTAYATEAPAPEPEPGLAQEPEDQPEDLIHVSGVDGIQDIHTGHNLSASVDLDGALEIAENITTLAVYAPGKWNRWQRITEKGQN